MWRWKDHWELPVTQVFIMIIPVTPPVENVDIRMVPVIFRPVMMTPPTLNMSSLKYMESFVLTWTRSTCREPLMAACSSGPKHWQNGLQSWQVLHLSAVLL